MIPSLHKAVARMLMRKNVNSDVSRGFPMENFFLVVLFIMLYKVTPTFSLSNGKFSLMSFTDQGGSCDSSSRLGS